MCMTKEKTIELLKEASKRPDEWIIRVNHPKDLRGVFCWNELITVADHLIGSGEINPRKLKKQNSKRLGYPSDIYGQLANVLQLSLDQKIN